MNRESYQRGKQIGEHLNCKVYEYIQPLLLWYRVQCKVCNHTPFQVPVPHRTMIKPDIIKIQVKRWRCIAANQARSNTWPRMWALECQKVSRPSSLSKLKILSSQSSSKGLFMSHNTPLTWEINAFAATLFPISFAISMGDECHLFPSFTVPSGKVILEPKWKIRIPFFSSIRENRKIRVLLDGVVREGLDAGELFRLNGLEELDAFGDYCIEIAFVFLVRVGGSHCRGGGEGVEKTGRRFGKKERWGGRETAERREQPRTYAHSMREFPVLDRGGVFKGVSVMGPSVGIKQRPVKFPPTEIPTLAWLCYRRFWA